MQGFRCIGCGGFQAHTLTTFFVIEVTMQLTVCHSSIVISTSCPDVQIMISCMHSGQTYIKIKYYPDGPDILFPYCYCNSQLQLIDKLFVLNNNTVAFMKSISALGLQAYLYIKPFGALDHRLRWLAHLVLHCIDEAQL